MNEKGVSDSCLKGIGNQYINAYFFLFWCIADNPKQSSRVPLYIKVLDVNDNAPEFAEFYETFVCEKAKADQVSFIRKQINSVRLI